MSKEQTKTTFAQRIGLWAYKLLCGILKLTDIRVVAATGRAVGYLVWLFSPARRRVVARNLRIAVDPMLREDKLGSMIRRNMVRTTMNLICSIKTGLLTDKEEERAINRVGSDIFRDHGINGHCVISCIPHAGNWEILARIRPHFSEVEHYSSMYRRLSNPLLEKMIYESRTRFGCEMYSKEDGLRAVLRLARTGGLMGVLSDQYTQEGLFIPYFGKVTGVTPLPALLYKRCKGKGHLFCVYTRNTGLGKWDAVLGRMIELPEGCETQADITMQVNLALEKCQSENILDGFWMHHRWKCPRAFAPEQPAEVNPVVDRYMRLPFRIIVCVPEQFEEAVLTIPMMRVLKRCRRDAELTVICPQEQARFWETQEYVTFVNTSDGSTPLKQQLDADEQYKFGPYDIAFMLCDNKRIFKVLQTLEPIHISGFADNKLLSAKDFNRRNTALPAEYCHAPRHKSADYLALLQLAHLISTKDAFYAAEEAGNAEVEGSFIAPFSTLSATDTWAEEKWAALIKLLPGKVTLLALAADRSRAEAMAQRLGIACVCCKPHEVAQHVGAKCRLYAVDGLLPQLAALANCPCTVIMANRLADRYAPLGNGHRTVFDHKPDYPAYGKDADKRTDATADISVENVLG